MAALAAAAVAVYSDLYVPQPLLPLLSREFGVAPATAGISISVVVLAIALSSSLHGALSDRLGRRPVMVTSLFLLALPTLLCATASTFPSLLVFRAFQGLLIPGVTAVAVAWLGDQFPGAALGAKVGVWIAASVAGGLTGRVVSGLVAQWLGWRAAFVLFGCVTLVAASAMARELPEGARPQGGRVAERGGALAHLRNRRLAGTFILGGAVFFGFIGIFTYLPYYLTAAPFHLGTGTVSSVFLVYLSGIFTSLMTEPFTRRYGERAVIGAGFAIAGAGAVLTLIPSLPAIIGALVVLCVGMFAVQSTAPAFVNRLAEISKGSAGALYVSFYYVGATLGAFLPGYALQAFGWPGVTAACLLAFAVGFLADWLLCS